MLSYTPRVLCVSSDLHKEVLCLMDKPGVAGEYRNAFAVSFSYDDRGRARVHYITDTPERAESLAQRNKGYFGAPGEVSTCRLICDGNDEWNLEVRPLPRFDFSEEDKAVEDLKRTKALAKLTLEEREILGL